MREAEAVFPAREEEMSQKCVSIYTCIWGGTRLRYPLSLKNADVLLYAYCGLVSVARCSLVASRAYARAHRCAKWRRHRRHLSFYVHSRTWEDIATKIAALYLDLGLISSH